MPLDKSRLQFDGDRAMLPTVEAPAGLPFFSQGAGGGTASGPESLAPRKAEIVKGGKGGGATGSNYDGGDGREDAA